MGGYDRGSCRGIHQCSYGGIHYWRCGNRGVDFCVDFCVEGGEVVYLGSVGVGCVDKVKVDVVE